jgi:hypothetical protein
MADRPVYRIAVEERAGWLHAIGTGDNVPENVLRFLREAYRACVERGFDALLLEVGFAGPSLPMGDIFRIVADQSEDGAKLRRIAYLERTAGRDRTKARFAETVAVNRAVNVRLFHDIEEAERWLAQP